jgi:uncharacterized tellurite resistance protein B-like protein
MGRLSLLRFLGLGEPARARESEPASLAEIGAELDALPAEEARFAAAFSYLLARVAGADLRTADVERDVIAGRLESFAGVDSDRARLLADTAIRAAAAHSASDDHLVARAFRDMTEEPERIQLLRCLYVVAAADEHISTVEDNEIFEVATAIGVRRTDVVALRMEFKEYLGSLKALPSER